MKYWLLTTEYPPFFGGGISTYCLHTARMLSEHQHQVVVFISDSSVNEIEEASASGIRIVRFNPDSAGVTELGHTTNLSYAFAGVVKKFIEAEGKPDVIEAQEYLGIAYYLLQFKLLLYSWCQNIPVIITAHSPAFLYLHYNHVPKYRYPDYWIGEMERFCLQAADQIISPSQYLIDQIISSFPLANKKICVIVNPFDFTEGMQDLPCNEVIFYGKLSPQKGTLKLLAYLKEMYQEGFMEPLHIYGGQDIVYHPEGKTMGNFVKNLYKDLIAKGLLVLHPQVPPAQRTSLSGAKVVIVPSTVDNLPYVVLEMMSLGNIVLVSKQGGQSEVVEDGFNGFVFDHEKAGSFKSKLLSILQMGIPERTLISRNAVETIKSGYNHATVYAQKIKLIQTVIKEQVPRRHFPFIRAYPPIFEVPKTHTEEGLLSIVIPYYNLGAYIQETISSIQRSTYRQIEIIIVNDGSNDKESLHVLEMLRVAPGIRVIDTLNAGLASARNSGALAAEGKFLAFIDADDTIGKTFYEKAIQVLDNFENVHFIGCWTQYFEGSNNLWPTFIPEPPIILYHNTINSSALIYKRTSFLQGGINDAHMPFTGLEDYESVISLVSSGYNGVVLPEPLFYYRVRSNSMIRALSTDKKLLLNEYISLKHQIVYATFAPAIVGLLQVNGPGFLLDNPSLDYMVHLKNPFLNKFAQKTIRLIKKNPRLKTVVLKIYRKFKS